MKIFKPKLQPVQSVTPDCISLDTLPRFQPSPQNARGLDGTLTPTRFTSYIPGTHTTALLYAPLNAPATDTTLPTGFVWDSNNNVLVYVNESDSERTKELMNFQLEFIGKTKVHSADGTKTYLKYRVYNDDSESIGLVDEAKASNFPKAYDAIVNGLKFHCLVPNDPLLKKYLTKVYNESEQSMIAEERYTLDGWWESPSGELKYLHSGKPNVENNLLLCPDFFSAEMFLQEYFSCVKSRVAIPVLIHCAYSLLAKFFTMAELPGIRSVMVIIGPSGSGKTKLCSMFANAFAKSEKTAAFYRLEDTRASLETEIPKRKDQIVIVDDLFPAGGQADVNNMEANFNTIVRMVGDSLVRNKCTGDRKTIADRNVRCALIVTGEYNFLPTFSSYARMTELEIHSGDINIALLQKLNNAKIKSKSFFGILVDHIQKHQTRILQNLHEEFNQSVDIIRNLGINQSRMVATFASMLVTERILASFANALGLVSYPTNAARDILLDYFRSYNHKLLSLSPEQLVIKAIREAYENNRFKIAKDEVSYKNAPFEGYIDGEWLTLSASIIEDCINEYKRKNKINFVYDDRIKQSLVKEDFFGLRNGKHTYKYTCNRKAAPRCSVMKINLLLL